MSNTCLKRKEKGKVTFRMGENKTEIGFVLIKKEHRRLLRNVKAIPEDFLHAFVLVDMIRRK